jgi:uncharacterized OB-fold protein
MTMDAAASPRPVLPLPDKLTAFFWEGAHRGQLMILRCEACGFYVHWPRPICKRCQSFQLRPEEVSGRGVLYSYTVGVQAFHPWFDARVPYILGVVELEEQPNLRLVTNLVGCQEAEVRIGMALQVQFEQLTAEISLPVFGPAAKEGK